MYNKTPVWTQDNNMVYFSVVSDGTIGSEWVKRLENQDKDITPWTGRVLESEDFQVTSGVVHDVVVFKGSYFKDKNRVYDSILKEANRCGLNTPKTEVACLIHEKFTSNSLNKMGLKWIIVFHDPILAGTRSARVPLLLGAFGDADRSWLSVYRIEDEILGWAHGFAFVR